MSFNGALLTKRESRFSDTPVFPDTQLRKDVQAEWAQQDGSYVNREDNEFLSSVRYREFITWEFGLEDFPRPTENNYF